MKKSILLALSFVLLLTMSSCGNADGETTRNLDAEQTGIEKSEENDDSPLLYAKYSEVLMQILTDRTDPNGRVFDDGSQGGDFSGNAFAVIDIDGDGRDELIFNFNDTYMAAMQEIIYDYDEENDILREELDAFFVMNTYYSNGYVKVDASHNHTCDPQTRGVWPYSLYQYDPQTDSYADIGYVQCWDELIFPTDYDGEVFPSELDTDEDNLLFFIVYYINGTDEIERTYMDREEFEAWEKTIFPDEYKIDIEYHKMTEEEIEKIQDGLNYLIDHTVFPLPPSHTVGNSSDFSLLYNLP